VFELRKQTAANLPQYLRSLFYWAVTAIMAQAGGVIVVIYLRSDIVKPIVAVNVGASAPLLIAKFVGQPPEPGSVD
jgi:hypothetical protein